MSRTDAVHGMVLPGTSAVVLTPRMVLLLWYTMSGTDVEHAGTSGDVLLHVDGVELLKIPGQDPSKVNAPLAPPLPLPLPAAFPPPSLPPSFLPFLLPSFLPSLPPFFPPSFPPSLHPPLCPFPLRRFASHAAAPRLGLTHGHVLTTHGHVLTTHGHVLTTHGHVPTTRVRQLHERVTSALDGEEGSSCVVRPPLTLALLAQLSRIQAQSAGPCAGLDPFVVAPRALNSTHPDSRRAIGCTQPRSGWPILSLSATHADALAGSQVKVLRGGEHHHHHHHQQQQQQQLGDSTLLPLACTTHSQQKKTKREKKHPVQFYA
eukprot:3452550-Rhodomonas_salina.1